jgi:hypothetical protein
LAAWFISSLKSMKRGQANVMGRLAFCGSSGGEQALATWQRPPQAPLSHPATQNWL